MNWKKESTDARTSALEAKAAAVDAKNFSNERKRSAVLLALGIALGAHLLGSFLYERAKVVAAPDESSTLSCKSTNESRSFDGMKAEIAETVKQANKQAMLATHGLKISPADAKTAKLDLAFCIDATSSMSGEIETVKKKVKSTVDQLSNGQYHPIVRVGLVAYRDGGDDFVTKVYPFTSDIAQIQHDISGLEAKGGGDGPEAVDAGLHVAINNLKWDEDKYTAKVMYLIGDAPAHTDRRGFDWKADVHKASMKGIRISTIGCDGLESYADAGIGMFKHVAMMTNGTYQPLVYHQEIVDAFGKRTTIISSAGKTYKVKPEAKESWKEGAEALVAKGTAASTSTYANGVAPALQGATCGTIGPQGGDATYVAGINTAGTVRSDNNLDSTILKGAQSALSNCFK